MDLKNILSTLAAKKEWGPSGEGDFNNRSSEEEHALQSEV